MKELGINVDLYVKDVCFEIVFEICFRIICIVVIVNLIDDFSLRKLK